MTMGKVAESEFFTPVFLFALPLLLILPSSGAGIVQTGIYFICGWLLWSSVSEMTRFLLPVYPAASLLSAAVLEGRGFGGMRRIIKYVVLSCCAFTVYLSVFMFFNQGRWDVLSGAVPADDYLSNSRAGYPYPSYAAIKYANDKLPAGSKVLFVGDAKSYPVARKFTADSVFDVNSLAEYARVSSDGADMFARIRADGITHIIFNPAEGFRNGVFSPFRDPVLSAKLADFWNRYLEQDAVFNDSVGGRTVNTVSVYAVKRRENGVPPPFDYINYLLHRDGRK